MNTSFINRVRIRELQTWKAFLAPKMHRISEFFGLQGITTAGNLLYGFLCVRLLPVSDYARYAVIFGFMGTLSVLMDVGTSGTLLPLIGERIDDHELIADCVASLRQLTNRLFILIAPIAIIVCPLILHRQHWNRETVAAIVSITLGAAWCARFSSAYGTVLIALRERTVWYRVQMISSLGTLALLGLIWGAGYLNAFSAVLINLAGMIFVSLSYFFQAHRLLGRTGRPSMQKRKAIVHLALPSIPNAIFYACQGQIALFLIVFFGRTTAVASVGALTRLSQIFIFVSQMNPLLIEPYFAKLPLAALKRNYLIVLGAASILASCAIGLAMAFPGLFLWILGPKYSGLQFEVLLLIAASSISYIHGVLWIIHSARRFVYWWNNTAIIVLTLAVQIVFIWKVDLSTVRAVLGMNLTTAIVTLMVSILTGVYGFVCGPRGAAHLAAARQESL